MPTAISTTSKLKERDHGSRKMTLVPGQLASRAAS